MLTANVKETKNKQTNKQRTKGSEWILFTKHDKILRTFFKIFLSKQNNKQLKNTIRGQPDSRPNSRLWVLGDRD